jgi:hypothetical protein
MSSSYVRHVNFRLQEKSIARPFHVVFICFMYCPALISFSPLTCQLFCLELDSTRSAHKTVQGLIRYCVKHVFIFHK